jgi:quercetin dioxygenase-like cupin family protein
MEIIRSDTRTSRPADAAYFTGPVWQEPVIGEGAETDVRALRVTFAPGARTAWHTHPRGQTLHVLSGVGRVATRGGPVEVIRQGDTVWIPPGEEHWHGAAPDRMMCHLAIQESVDGRAADWLEHVSDADYAG